MCISHLMCIYLLLQTYLTLSTSVPLFVTYTVEFFAFLLLHQCVKGPKRNSDYTWIII